jgi:hypothetical protein
MRSLGCIRTGNLLGRRRSSGLSAAQALRVEEHLGSCARCSEDAALLDGMRALASSLPNTLSPMAREHAIRAALAQAGSIQPAASPLARLWPAGALGAAALLGAAAAFALVLRVAAPDDRGEPMATARSVAKPAAEASARVMAGEVEMNGRLYGRDAAIGASSALRSDDGATIALGHAVVELRPGTALRWLARTHELRLEEGSVVADVDPGRMQPFTVVTPDFAVLVLGTRFEVALDEVKVERGRVRVVATDGAVLAESLGEGERLVVPHAAELELDALPSASEPRGRTNRAKPTRSARAQKDPSALLSEARAHLAARRVADARQSIETALALARSRGQRAEAMSLRAECALVEGDLASAVEVYLRVARAFGHDPAGQNALFAAARLEAERGRSASAATLLERYLARYPKGRFVNEARTRLRELGAVLDRAP